MNFSPSWVQRPSSLRSPSITVTWRSIYDATSKAFASHLGQLAIVVSKAASSSFPIRAAYYASPSRLSWHHGDQRGRSCHREVSPNLRRRLRKALGGASEALGRRR